MPSKLKTVIRVETFSRSDIDRAFVEELKKAIIKRNMQWIATIVLVLAMIIAFVFVFPNQPDFSISEVKYNSLNVSINPFINGNNSNPYIINAGSISLNITVSIANSNNFGFKVDALAIGVYYRSFFLGEVDASNLNFVVPSNGIAYQELGATLHADFNIPSLATALGEDAMQGYYVLKLVGNAHVSIKSIKLKIPFSTKTSLLPIPIIISNA